MTYPNPTWFRGAAVPVAPTPITIAVVDVRDTARVTIYAKNLHASQTLSVTIQRRSHSGDDFSEGPVYDELTAIPPLTPRSVDVDCGVHSELRLTGVASGGGLNMDAAIKPDSGRR